MAHFHTIVKMKKSESNYGKLGSCVQSEQQQHPHLKGGNYKRIEMPNNRTYMEPHLKLPTIKTSNRNWENVTMNELKMLTEEVPFSEYEDVGYSRLSSCVEDHTL